VDTDPVASGIIEFKDEITAVITECWGVGSSITYRKEPLIFLAASLLVSVGILFLLGYNFLRLGLKPYEGFISDQGNISSLFRVTGDWVPIVYIPLWIKP
jgi:hypothetical protein